MRTKAWTGLVLSLPLVLALVAGCGGGTKEEATPAPQGGTQAEAPPAGTAATAGTGANSVKGSVTLAGTPPKPATIKMDADPFCKTQHATAPTAESVVTNADGTLRNVFVYVKSGLPAGQTYAPPAEPAVLDQKGCTYIPHVQGVMVGQKLQILNSDGTLHNIHSLAKNSPQFNVGMPTAGMKISQEFKAEELMVRVKCDVHPWMETWIGVLNHPFFAVSGDGGAFEIKNLPAGTYTIEAWHEKFGAQTQTVTVTDGQPAEVSFTFQATA
jgi:Carboxypeptidase regulatory-like domain